MAVFRRVAITIDLQWPLSYHHNVFAGVLRYARERGEAFFRHEDITSGEYRRQRCNSAGPRSIS
jgi:hypothetical protein